MWSGFIPCNYVLSFEWTVTVTAPDDTLHEAFFDPVTDGSAVAADGSNGVLKPATFTDANGASATIERIAWEAGAGESGTVKLKLSPHSGIAGHIVDFIALYGSAPLSLIAAAATVDAAADTLSWSMSSRPWEDGDKLMLRIREGTPAPVFESSFYTFEIAEDAEAGTAVGTVSAIDPGGDAVTYSITGGNVGAAFTIDQTAGEISVAGELDHESVSSYALTVEARDGGGNAAVVDVAIDIISIIVDYDADDDGLIEVSGLVQLNAIRWDLDGDGSSTGPGHAAAFPGASGGMGCPTGGCTGYELTADLDFDTDGSGSADSGDDYWNDGSGWAPIGDSANHFRAAFEGNGHTLSNLFIDRGATNRVGLFGHTAARSVIRNVVLLSADVTGGSAVGGLVGYNDDGTVAASCVTGNVAGKDYVGGLAGKNDGAVVNGCGASNVTGGSAVGGLVGWNFEIITGSYATGNVVGASLAGGLVGRNDGAVTNSYAMGNVTASREVGGLVGGNYGRVTNGYAAGRSSGDNLAGGLAGGSSGRAAVTDSYWDTEASGLSSSAGGAGKTTVDLQSPTSSAGIYSAWDDAAWDFGTSTQYPALKADFDGDSTATWQEFGDQRPGADVP